MIEAVIYDVDGTLVDSEPLHVASWDQALQHFGYSLNELSPSFRASFAGRKPIAIAEGMAQDLQASFAPAELVARKTTLFEARARTHLVALPGASESIKRFKARGWRLGIGTSVGRTYVEQVLQLLDAVGDFEVIVTGDEIQRSKPDPQTYTTAVQKLRLEPAQCVVLEDAQAGVTAAKAAGCWCVAVVNTHAVPQDVSAADRAVATLNDVTVELLRELAP